LSFPARKAVFSGAGERPTGCPSAWAGHAKQARAAQKANRTGARSNTQRTSGKSRGGRGSGARRRTKGCRAARPPGRARYYCAKGGKDTRRFPRVTKAWRALFLHVFDEDLGSLRAHDARVGQHAGAEFFAKLPAADRDLLVPLGGTFLDQSHPAQLLVEGC